MKIKHLLLALSSCILFSGCWATTAGMAVVQSARLAGVTLGGVRGDTHSAAPIRLENDSFLGRLIGLDDERVEDPGTEQPEVVILEDK